MPAKLLRCVNKIICPYCKNEEIKNNYKEDYTFKMCSNCFNNMNKKAQDIINESEGLSSEEKTEFYLSKMARGELK